MNRALVDRDHARIGGNRPVDERALAGAGDAGDDDNTDRSSRGAGMQSGGSSRPFDCLSRPPWQIDDLIAKDEFVVCRVTVSGTFGVRPHRPPDPLPNGWVGVESTALIPPSAAGKPYSVKHIHIFRIADGLIAEHWRPGTTSLCSCNSARSPRRSPEDPAARRPSA